MGPILGCGVGEIKMNGKWLDVSLLDQQLRNFIKAWNPSEKGEGATGVASPGAEDRTAEASTTASVDTVGTASGDSDLSPEPG